MVTELRFWHVLAAGGVGGLLSLVYALAVGDEIALAWYAAAAAYTMLGAAAGVIGVYVLAVSDTKAVTRCAAFALLCGMVWRPVIDAGGAWITQAAKQKNDRELTRLSEELHATTASIPRTSVAELPMKLTALEQTTAKVIRLLRKASDSDVRADAEDSVRSAVAVVQRMVPQRPRESVNMLSRLGLTAVETGQPQLAMVAIGALHDIGAASADPGVSVTAYGALDQVARAADARPDAPLAAEARYLGAEMVVTAAVRADAAGRSALAAGLPIDQARKDLAAAQLYFEMRGDAGRVEGAKRKALDLEKLSRRPPGHP